MSGFDTSLTSSLLVSHTEAAETSPMDCGDDGARGFHTSACRFTPLRPVSASPKRLSQAKVITVNIRVNKMVRRLHENINEYAAWGSLTIRGKRGGGQCWTLFPRPQYSRWYIKK